MDYCVSEIMFIWSCLFINKYYYHQEFSQLKQTGQSLLTVSLKNTQTETQKYIIFLAKQIVFRVRR